MDNFHRKHETSFIKSTTELLIFLKEIFFTCIHQNELHPMNFIKQHWTKEKILSKEEKTSMDRKKQVNYLVKVSIRRKLGSLRIP